jgi:tryptophan-rich sensory protein
MKGRAIDPITALRVSRNTIQPKSGTSVVRPIAILIGFVAATAAVAAFGAQFLPGEWYASLAKPAWTPPNWVFGPVWTLLYIMIALAGWFAWRSEGFGLAVYVWIAALVANGLWSWLFFGLHQVAAAMADLVLLLALIVAFMALAWRTARPAALLFLPYFAWVSYACTLNAGVLALNP